MVKGETYYRKLQSAPSVDLSGYTGTWKLSQNSNDVANFSGTLSQTGSYYEVMFQTASLGFGSYRVECFNIHPDGFIECILDEIIEIN